MGFSGSDAEKRVKKAKPGYRIIQSEGIRYTKIKKTCKFVVISEVSFSDGEEHSYEIKAPLSKAKKGIFWNFSSKKNKVWTKTRTGELVGMAIVNGNFLMALWRDQKGIIGWTVELEGAASIPNKRELEYRRLMIRLLEN